MHPPEPLSSWVSIGLTPEREVAHLWSLVLHAADIEHELFHGAAGWQLLVPEENIIRARQELLLFSEENQDWPPERPFRFERETIVENAPPVLPVIGGLVVFYGVTGAWESHSHWFDIGALDRFRVLHDGQWWRLVTALTLHADSVHLLGNIFFGGVLVYSLCRHLGSGIAWFSVLCTGVLANGINVFFHDDLYRSIGFSTAVFGMVGILSGMRLRRIGGWQEMVLALGSAASLLALMGSSGERTDLGAHFWGVFVGLLVGMLLVALGLAGKRVLAPAGQWLLFVASLAMVFGCWLFALYPRSGL
ncbi:rhomboid family intramembrane serine protease [Thiovibrio frasassiensis]|uniref:Rhomboid family intramembrane serine protease n=1 Tax=Thiovibrio frasassiensis TaxID=2984131 RepID=A0A9X4MDU3_9BACT|nr:rhomboid family intramembrane serine protease [Thiovibrio frasassiensis]MDG4474747.1 rhomboid family intramembrane serine protease [Thiovibrio frasassiensis]